MDGFYGGSIDWWLVVVSMCGMVVVSVGGCNEWDGSVIILMGGMVVASMGNMVVVSMVAMGDTMFGWHHLCIGTI